MLTIARRAGIVVLAIFLVLTVAIMLFAEPLIEFSASKALGRDVEIAGDVDFGLSPFPTISVSRVSVANAKWSQRQNMFEADFVSVSVRPRTLFDDPLSLSNVSLTVPVLYLERSSKGGLNWTKSRTAITGEDKAKHTLPKNQQIPFIENLTITDGRVIYEDHAANTRVAATVARLEGQAAKGNPVRLAGKGEVDGLPYRLDVNAGPLGRLYGADPYPVEIDIQSGAMHAHGEGTIAAPMELEGVNMQLLLEGDNLASLWRSQKTPSAPLIIHA